MVDASNFAKLVPGFDFLEGLVKNAGSAMPGIGQWVAPTLNPEEIEKRIDELRTVQFWLEQNARMLGATIQALEVQRMTLSTLKTMNVQMNDLRDSLLIKMPTMPGAGTAEAAPQAPPPAAAKPAPKKPPPEVSEAQAAPPAVDPMQWWGALTKQFTELAAAALKEAPADAAAKLAGAVLEPLNAAVAKAPRPAAAKPAAKARRAAPRKRSRAST